MATDVLTELPERLANCYVVDVNACWHWCGSVVNTYGACWYEGRTRRAHRVFYELLRGPLPDGMTIDHLCYNRLCVNPDHMDVCSAEENRRRGARRRTHCKNGHEMTPENTKILNDAGWRECRQCGREKARKRWANLPEDERKRIVAERWDRTGRDAQRRRRTAERGELSSQ